MRVEAGLGIMKFDTADIVTQAKVAPYSVTKSVKKF